jgi:hypothetical protein
MMHIASQSRQSQLREEVNDGEVTIETARDTLYLGTPSWTFAKSKKS